MASFEIPDEAIQKVFDHILDSPKLLVGLFCSYFSGHMWVYLTIAHLKKTTKGNTVLKSWHAKICLGCSWFCLILIPVYWLQYSDLRFVYSNILAIIIPVIVFSFALQLLVYLLVTKFEGGK